ncbi:MAG: protein-glutamate O-methyltransferase CheR [Candidatus Manganitrophaceae bacterium]
MVTRDLLDFFFALLRKESGLMLDESKRYLIESRLEPLAIQEGFSSIEELGRHVRKHRPPLLLRKVVEAMTTHETSFFRDSAPFEIVQRVFLPEIMNANQKTRRIRIWSAACSTGQEAYSIAMILCETGLVLGSWDVHILGTDLSDQALEKARAGLYTPHEVQRGLPIHFLKRFFISSPDGWRIDAGVKRWVEFRHDNLISNYSSLGVFDLIFCRNILIYFDIETKRRVLARIARSLPPRGLLFLGAAESLVGVTDLFERIETEKWGYYRKRDT